MKWYNQDKQDAKVPKLSEPLGTRHNGRKKKLKEKTEKQLFDSLRSSLRDMQTWLPSAVNIVKRHEEECAKEKANPGSFNINQWWGGFAFQRLEDEATKAEILLDFIDKKRYT